VITRLAKLRSLFVIGQGTVFALHERGLALQLQGIFEVSLLRHGLMASSPGGPSDDERRLDPALR
jgi:hypothetical protein